MLDTPTTERISALGATRPILVALSGGGDSTALLHLMAERFGAERLIAGIVDHGLRRGSADDAARAARFAESIGVRAHITTLTWEEGANRSQHAARERRYAALAALANSAQSKVIVTGHNRDDQAETVLMRASRGGGWRNLVAMRPITSVPLWPEGRGLFLARPLLGVRRTALRDYLRDHDLSWIDDPANDSLNYERVLARQRLAAHEASGFDTMRLAAIAERLAPLAAQIDDVASALIDRAVRLEGGTATFDVAEWAPLSVVHERAFWLLITAVSGGAYGPSPRKSRILNALLFSKRAFTGRTLGGALVQRRGDEVRISRDRGGLYGRADGACAIPDLPLVVGAEAVWDGRVALKVEEAGWAVVLGKGAQPELERDGERRPIDEAAPIWLLKERVRHLLGQD